MKIDLLGTSFTLRSDEDPEYLQDIVDFIRAKITEVRSTVDTRDNLKIAILTSILLTDELFKERERNRNGEEARQSDEVNRIAGDLISRIDDTLASPRE